MRTAAFYFLLSFPILIWCFIVLPTFSDNLLFIPENIVSAILRISPIIGADLSIFGEVTPLLIASGIIALMPSAQEDVKYKAVVLIAVTYLFYLSLSIFFSLGVGEGIISAVSGTPTQSQNKILGIISNVRTMTIVMAASMFGYKFKSNQS